MSLPARFFGVFFRPGRTFQELTHHPVWVDALVIVLVTGAAASYLGFPYVQRDRLLALAGKATAFTEAHGEQQYAAAVERIKGESRSLHSFVVSPLAMLTGLLFTALIALGAGRLLSHQGHYLQVFSCLLHAGFVVNFLGNAVGLAMAAAQPPTSRLSTGLPAFFPGFAPGSIVHAALGPVDIFSLWMFGLLGLGLAAAFKISVGKGLAVSYALWLLRVLAVAAFTAAGKRFFF